MDRDGTLNEDKGYVHKVEDFKLLPGVIKGLRLLQEKFLFFIVTNQSGIGKGFYTANDFLKFNNLLCNTLKEHGIQIEKTCYCPHTAEEGCNCRKPKIYNIDKCVSEFNIDLRNSWVIGDHPSDIQLGMNAGCKTIYLCTGEGTYHFSELEQKKIAPTIIARDFLTAANKILEFDF